MTGRDLYLRLLTYVKPYWRQFGVALFAMILLAATEPAIPALLKPMLDGTFVDKDPDVIRWTPVILIGLFLIRGSMSFLNGVAFEWVAGKVVLDLRRQMFERIMTLPTAYFDANSTGNLIARVTFNVNQVTNASTKVLTVLVKDSIIVIGLLGYMFYLNWLLTLIMFVLLPMIALIVRLLAKRLRRISRSLQQAMGDMTHVLEEGVRGHKVIKVFAGKDYEERRFDKLANWVRRYNMKTKVAGMAHEPAVELAAALMMAVLIYVGTHETVAGELTVGGFVSLMAAVGLIFSPIKRLTSINEALQKGLAAAENVFELIDQEAERDAGERQLSDVKGRLTFCNVGFRYPSAKRDALKEVSFEAAPGETIALVGRSGGGKTTVAALIPRFYSPGSGTILLDGTDIEELTLHSLRANLSYVGQESVLFDDTVAANIAYGAGRQVTQEAIEQAARDAHALEFIQRLPGGFESQIGEDGVRLSGGQRQRLAIARALIKDAPVLLLDEATSALDTESERMVQEALGRLTANRTTLVIAHRLSTVKHADRILVLKEGRIVEQGSHEELIRLEGEYTELCRHQFGVKAQE
ncbi:MAG: lipid A export permease/ATP-binding protein MsbA [Chromatiaceae bacterium]|nr:lipid A export permease/ATP-binding protein MsbA [Chromatiaceae bacterium]MCP5442786.1 lipid A export permease/ATP-binding protein MsbA [Chromatiaceae bacterium]